MINNALFQIYLSVNVIFDRLFENVTIVIMILIVMYI